MKFNLNTWLWIGIAVLLTLQISSWLSGTRVSKKMIENEVKLEQLEKEVPLLESELGRMYGKYDSLLIASSQRYEDLENKKQPIRNARDKTPSVVSSFDKEQLRRAIAKLHAESK